MALCCKICVLVKFPASAAISASTILDLAEAVLAETLVKLSIA